MFPNERTRALFTKLYMNIRNSVLLSNIHKSYIFIVVFIKIFFKSSYTYYNGNFCFSSILYLCYIYVYKTTISCIR